MLFFRGTPVSQEVEEDIVDIFLEDSDLHAKSKAYLHSSNRLQGQARKTVLVLQVGNEGHALTLSGLHIPVHGARSRAFIRF